MNHHALQKLTENRSPTILSHPFLADGFVFRKQLITRVPRYDHVETPRG